MNNDNDFDQTSGYQPPVAPPTPPEPVQSAWQPPTQIPPNPSQPVQPSQPAVELARQQLANAYQTNQPQQPQLGSQPPIASPETVTPAAYNPYHTPQTAYSLPNPPTPPAPAPAPAPDQAPVDPVVPVQPDFNLGPATAVHGQVEPEERSVAEIKQQLMQSVRGNRKPTRRWKPILTAVVVGLAFLLINYNEVALAQIRLYVSPSSTLSPPVIVDPSAEVKITNEPRIIIPKINVDVPVVYDIKTYDESDIQDGLERGVVHYGDTAIPGQIGNNVIVGHSSNNFFNSGKYKFAFVLLDRLQKDDTFILHYKGTRYIYKVFNKQIIEPTDFSLIQPTDKPVVTLITCTPPGTAWHRLVIQAEQISPSAANAQTADTHIPDDIGSPIPGNAPSLWSQFWENF